MTARLRDHWALGRLVRAFRDDPPDAALLRPDPRTDVEEAADWDARRLNADAHRPHPAANAWPDDAVLLTYAELRQLVALHLELCARTLPAEKPWEWAQSRAKAMRDGEIPLLIADVIGA